MSTYFEAMNRLERETPPEHEAPTSPAHDVPPAHDAPSAHDVPPARDVPTVLPVDRAADALPARVRRPDPVLAGHAALRESLLARADGRRLKTIVFAGCAGGEGCSRLVAGVARTFADAGLYVLLVDADPRVTDRRVGWRRAREVIETVPVEPAPAAVDAEEAHLTTTRSPAAVPEKERFFDDGRFARWLETQRQVYDYVLIDAPPLLRFADAALMGRECDGVVLVTAAGWTARKSVVRARERLERAHVNVVGAVLNRASDPIPDALRDWFGFLRD
jgi:capsular exopolysaccharide synthesis family protein